MCSSLSADFRLQTTPFNEEYEIFWLQAANGRGSSGAVVRPCKHLASGQMFAVKMLRYSDAALSEIQAWKDCTPHPNIVNLHAAFDTGSLPPKHALLGFSTLVPGHYIFAVMDHLVGGGLLRFMSAQTLLSEGDAAFIVAQIVCACQHMHSLGYCHGDLKPDNILIETPDALHVRVIDFGFARTSPLPVGFSRDYTATRVDG